VTNPRGFVDRFTLNADGYPTTITWAVGRPEAQTTTYARQANLLTSLTDALGRRTDLVYTAAGYLQSVTRPGPSGAVSWFFTYRKARATPDWRRAAHPPGRRPRQHPGPDRRRREPPDAVHL